MLALACRNTAKIVRLHSQLKNVRLGRNFTKKETAVCMANLFSLSEDRNAYTILDPGAGTGILACALIERICKEVPKCKQIFVTCYENNPDYTAMLEENLERVRKKCRHDYDVKLFATVYRENYLTRQKDHFTVTFEGKKPDTFDLIICSPPMEMIEKGSEEALAVGGVTQVKIQACYLFLRTALQNSEPDGQLVFYLPTAGATATSLCAVRNEILERCRVSGIHLFVGKQKNKSRAVPLGKYFCLALRGGEKPETVQVRTSLDRGTEKNTVALAPLPYDFIVDPLDGMLTLPKSSEDAAIVRHLGVLPETLSTLGLKLNTGRVLDARCRTLLFSEPLPGTVPLIRPSMIRRELTQFSDQRENSYLSAAAPNLLQKKKNYVFIKRVPAKSDTHFVNASLFLTDMLPDATYIATHNKVVYVDTKDRSGEMNERLCVGIYAFLNSTIYDRYVCIISKSGQVSSKELASLPLPARDVIESIGERLIGMRRYDTEACDSVVNPALRIVKR